jgi:hypothetical protein
MRSAVARRVRALLGRRGVPLVILGIGKIVWGISFIVSPTSIQGLGLLTRWAPLHCWAWVWIWAGVVTFGCAWVRSARDWLGFFAASVPPLLWGVSYGIAALDGQYPRGVWIFIWYMTSHVGMILWASTVPEHSLPLRRGRGDA